MISRLSADGAVVTGFLQPLEPLLGAGSFDNGTEDSRFEILLESGGRLAGELRFAWEGMQAEIGEPAGALRESVRAAGRGVARVQRELTGLREAARFQRLDVSIRALPSGDMRQMAWLNLDRFCTTWVAAWPSPESRLSNAEFVEVAARYFGMASPACAAFVGLRIGAGGAVMDVYGSRLSSATLLGDGYRMTT
jgi:hypothetical protein